MDHLTAILSDDPAPQSDSHAGQLRELRRVLRALNSGDDGARANGLGNGPLADIGAGLNVLADALESAGRRARALEDEVNVLRRFRTEFLANVSHELRTPLNNLLILSGTLSQNHSRNLDADQVSYATTIFECGRDLLRMINDMLDLGAPGISAGHAPEIAVATIVADAEQFFRPLATEKGLEFTIEVGASVGESLPIDGDRTSQVLFNLLSNAFKFTEAGEVRLVITRVDDTLIFAVHDTGIGIAADQINLIFNAFAQVDGSINRGFGGAGLGLTISGEVAAALGGRILVESEVGRGSVFRLEFPRSRGGQA